MNPEEFIRAFKTVLRKGLPGDDAHQTLLPIKRLSARNAIANKTQYRKSAIAIVLYPSDSKIKCILIQRPSYDGVHGGQVSFPGGKADDTDIDLRHTAIRECLEEINQPLKLNDLIGELSPVYIPVSNFMVQPFVFFIDEISELSPDLREVESIFHFNIDLLLNEETLQKTNLKISKGIIQKDVPYFSIESKVVWGATSMMLSELKEIMKLF